MSDHNRSGDDAPERVSPIIRRVYGALSYSLSTDWLWIVLVVLVAFIAAWPAISQPGLLNTRGGGDSPFLLQRLHQLTAALADGHFPARWMPDANYGYGYPFYNFYAPLSIYVAAVFRFLGFSFVRAIHLAQLAGFVVAGLGMFHLGRRWLGSRWAGLLAAAAYTVAPFHMVNVYTRGDSLAEFWAMAFYPLALLAADNLLDALGNRPAAPEGRQPPLIYFGRPLVLFALAYTALILSHNISALIFSPFLLLYLIVRLPAVSPGQSLRQRVSSLVTRHAALVTLLALALAFALSAWFFVPALAEQHLAQLGPVTEGYFHYSNHFRGRDLVQSGLLFDYNPDGGVAFRLGLVQAVLGLAGAVALVVIWWLAARRPSFSALRHSQIAFILLGAAVAVFMVTPLSRPLWDHLPLLPFTQFPWRFLSVGSFFLALLTGALALAADHLPGRAAIAVLGSLILLAAGLLGLRVDHLMLTDADVTAERLAEYEWFTGNIGTTVSAEYLTPESSPRPWTSAWLNTSERDRAAAVSGEATAGLVERTAMMQTWWVTAAEDGAEIVFPTLYWPGWRATLDGSPLELRPYPASGLMAAIVPTGEHTITLTLGRTPIRLVAEVMSLVALIVTVVLALDRPPGGRGAALTWRSPLAALLLLGGLALLWRGDAQDISRGDLTWDFAQMAYLHHARSGVAFSDGSRLHEYGYSADTLAAGSTLTVTLSVEPGEARTATLALVTPASARPTPDGAADPPLFAAQEITFDGDSAVFRLDIAADTPPGLYIPRLTLDGARPLMPSGATRGDLFLRPIKVSRGAEEQRSRGAISNLQSPISSQSTSLDVRALSLSMRDETTLDGRFAWYTARPLGARYQFSWRLQDPAGGIVAQLDAQPGYGFQPSTLWPAGQWTADWLALPLPDSATAAGDYPLVMRLYDVTTGDSLLTRRVGTVAWDGDAWRSSLYEPSFLLPDGVTPAAATFGVAADNPTIALRGYRLEREANSLRLTLYWEALAIMVGDYTRFVHLSDATGNVVAQVDGAAAAGSYPTGQWMEGEIVADALTFDLGALPAGGEYRLATGFYRPVEGLPRLEAAGADGPLPDGRFILPEIIAIP